MISRFLKDRRGNYAMMMGIAMLPIMGSLAIAVDFSEMNRQKQATINALDAAGIATARQVVTGASDAALIAYANDFFEANLGSVDPDDTELTVVLPNNQFGGGTLKLTAVLNYQPYFLPAFTSLLGKDDEDSSEISFAAKSEIRLKNTLEVALVLDNSGSMDEYGSGSGQKRLALLKTAAKQLVDTLALQAAQIKQVEKPVQFALVPFAASVNVGPENAGAAWMDVEGLSPVHHENFDWSTFDDADKRAEQIGGIWYKKGAGWGDEAGPDPVAVFALPDMKEVSRPRMGGPAARNVSARNTAAIDTCKRGHWRETGYVRGDDLDRMPAGRAASRPAPIPTTSTTTPARAAPPTPASASAIRRPCSCRCSRPTSRATAGRSKDPDEPTPNDLWRRQQLVERRHREQHRQHPAAQHEEVFRCPRPTAPTSSQGSGPNYSCTTSRSRRSPT